MSDAPTPKFIDDEIKEALSRYLEETQNSVFLGHEDAACERIKSIVRRHDVEGFIKMLDLFFVTYNPETEHPRAERRGQAALISHIKENLSTYLQERR